MSLRDKFPQAFLDRHKVEQHEHFKGQIIPKTVVRLPSNLTLPPKPKLFLIISIEPLLLFIINSKVYERYEKRTKDALTFQANVLKKDNGFLDNDSVIDCWKLWEEFEYEEIVSLCAEGKGEIKGTLSENTIKEIIDKVCGCPTFTNNEINTIVNSLC